MSEKSRPEFILEAIKILLWPILIVIAVIWLQDDVVKILKSRTWKIGIIEVGDRIETLENNVQDELILQKDYLNKIQANYSDADKIRKYVQQALNSIENAQRGVKKEIQTIQEAIPERRQSQPVSSKTTEAKPNTAKGWEHLGFNKLVEKDIQEAIEAFTESVKLWPDYHNVSEIRRLLVEKRENLKAKDSSEWTALYKTILEKYSWGMPSNVRRQLQQLQNNK
jgi:tetratricopeptide (TPR) repeat protein